MQPSNSRSPRSSSNYSLKAEHSTAFQRDVYWKFAMTWEIIYNTQLCVWKKIMHVVWSQPVKNAWQKEWKQIQNNVNSVDPRVIKL